MHNMQIVSEEKHENIDTLGRPDEDFVKLTKSPKFATATAGPTSVSTFGVVPTIMKTTSPTVAQGPCQIIGNCTRINFISTSEDIIPLGSKNQVCAVAADEKRLEYPAVDCGKNFSLRASTLPDKSTGENVYGSLPNSGSNRLPGVNDLPPNFVHTDSFSEQPLNVKGDEPLELRVTPCSVSQLQQQQPLHQQQRIVYVQPIRTQTVINTETYQFTPPHLNNTPVAGMSVKYGSSRSSPVVSQWRADPHFKYQEQPARSSPRNMASVSNSDVVSSPIDGNHRHQHAIKNATDSNDDTSLTKTTSWSVAPQGRTIMNLHASQNNVERLPAGNATTQLSLEMSNISPSVSRHATEKRPLNQLQQLVDNSSPTSRPSEPLNFSTGLADQMSKQDVRGFQAVEFQQQQQQQQQVVRMGLAHNEPSPQLRQITDHRNRYSFGGRDGVIRYVSDTREMDDHRGFMAERAIATTSQPMNDIPGVNDCQTIPYREVFPSVNDNQINVQQPSAVDCWDRQRLTDIRRSKNDNREISNNTGMNYRQAVFDHQRMDQPEVEPQGINSQHDRNSNSHVWPSNELPQITTAAASFSGESLGTMSRMVIGGCQSDSADNTQPLQPHPFLSSQHQPQPRPSETYSRPPPGYPGTRYQPSVIDSISRGNVGAAADFGSHGYPLQPANVGPGGIYPKRQTSAPQRDIDVNMQRCPDAARNVDTLSSQRTGMTQKADVKDSVQRRQQQSSTQQNSSSLPAPHVITDSNLYNTQHHQQPLSPQYHNMSATNIYPRLVSPSTNSTRPPPASRQATVQHRPQLQYQVPRLSPNSLQQPDRSLYPAPGYATAQTISPHRPLGPRLLPNYISPTESRQPIPRAPPLQAHGSHSTGYLLPPQQQQPPSPQVAQGMRQCPDTVSVQQNNFRCETCNRPAAFVCSGCKIVPYCSPDCQAVSWRRHHSTVCNTR
jgi:hypothetical protein